MEGETSVEMEIITTEVADGQPPPNQEIDAERNSRLRRLFKAARDGDWKAAKLILKHDQQAKTARLNDEDHTALHLAAYFGQSEFVEKLLSLLTAEELQIRNKYGNTALHHVAISASVDSAKAMVNKNPSLPQLTNDKHETPFSSAARWRHPSRGKDMLEYLYSVTDNALLWTAPSAPDLVIALIFSKRYDICLRLLTSNPELALAPNPLGCSIIDFLDENPSAFISGSQLSLWESLICPWINNVSARQQRHSDALKLLHFICSELEKKSAEAVIGYFFRPDKLPILQVAIRYGVFEVVEVCLNYFPDLLFRHSDTWNPLSEAVEHRRVRIFNHLISLYGGSVGMTAELKFVGSDNNILHLAARLAPWQQLHSVPGPAFQIQRELQWFKAVDALVSDEERLHRNGDKKTPEELFFKEHEALFGSAKEWMKDTSNSCMLVATLVTTVAFAAMITVPGGNNSETGMPILSQKRLFLAFSISNALSMISSAISLLMFLSVQTSRYTEEDFLESLPNILLRGLLSLFVAVATMMIAFGTALGMAFQTKVKWAYIPITIVACIPVIIFTKLNVRLLFQTFVLTSGPRIFGERRDPKQWWLKNLIYRFLPSHHDHMD